MIMKFLVFSFQFLVTRIRSIHKVFLKTNNSKLETTRGFTLVEMIVATALFSVVILVSVTALLSLVYANRKAQSLHSVMNNLNIALDSMVRAVRMGTDYHCITDGPAQIHEAQDCPGGDVALAFEAFDGDPNDSGDQWVYLYDPMTKRIYKSEDSGVNLFAITAPSVSIDSLTFYVVGTVRLDAVQPKVVIRVKGTAGAEDAKTKTTFHIQSTAVQRALDL